MGFIEDDILLYQDAPVCFWCEVALIRIGAYLIY